MVEMNASEWILWLWVAFIIAELQQGTMNCKQISMAPAQGWHANVNNMFNSWDAFFIIEVKIYRDYFTTIKLEI